MSKKTSQLTIQRRVRVGEGSIVEATRTTFPGADGKTGVTVAIDLSQAPVPDRKYVADSASVLKDDLGIKLCFAQRKLGSKELRSLLVIHLTFGAVRLFLKGINEFAQQLKSFAEKVRLPRVQLIDIKQEPAQTVALTANIIGASFAGRDSCLDLFHASPYVISELRKGSPFAAEPIVRVNLGTALVVAIFEQLESMELPESAEEDL